MTTDIGPSQPALVDVKGRIWNERTVIVNRDNDGFGFTLADASPVSVTGTTENGSAARAGIIVGDKIIKVNGITVMGKTHDDVIEMIKGNSHVALTLLCRSLGTNGTKPQHTIGLSPPMAAGAAKGHVSPSKDNITHPIPAEPQVVRESMEVNIQSLKSMLLKQRNYYEQLTVDYSKSPNKRLEKEIADCQYTIKRLEEQIASKSTVIENHILTTKASVLALRNTGRHDRKTHHEINKQPSTKEVKSTEITVSTTLSINNSSSVDTVSPLQPSPAKKGGVPPRKSASIHAFSGNPLARPPLIKTQSLKDGHDPSPKSKKHSINSVHGTEDASQHVSKAVSNAKFGAINAAEMFSDESDDETTEAFSPYTNLKDLKNFTAHTAVFMHYLASNRDPKDMAFYLVAGSYQQVTKGAEMRQRALDIFWTFFIENAPLKLDPWDGSIEVINKIRGIIETDEIPDIMLRNVFAEARKHVAVRIQRDLGEFKLKINMGLGAFFGDQQVHDNMSPEQAIETAFLILLPDIKRYNEEAHHNDPATITRNHAMAASMATFLVDVSKSKSKSIELLERVNTFVQLDPSKLRKGYKRQFAKNGHNFVLTSYRKPRYCDYCKKLLWGIGFHGYQCQVCEYNVHKVTCHDFVESCKKVQKASRSLFQRKPSVNFDEENENTEPNATKPSCIEEAENENKAPSPPITFPPSNTQAQFDERPLTKESRSRSISDPKHPQPFGSVTFDYNPDYRQEKRDSAVLRTQSERYTTRPDSANRYHMYTSNGDLHHHQSITSVSTISIIDEDRSSWQPDPAPDGVAVVRTPTPIDDDLLTDLKDPDMNVEEELLPWVKCHQDIARTLKKHEQKRQELIKELVYTERTHMKKLKVMLCIYKRALTRQRILHLEEVGQLFPSLEDLVFLHGGLLLNLKERVASSKDELVTRISDVLLQAFTEQTGEKLKKACSEFASNQARAERLFKTWRKTNEKFKLFVKEAESHPLCHRLKITELIPIAWQRLTKYTLLIGGIIKTYSHKSQSETDATEVKDLQKALSSVKAILHYVNHNVKQADLYHKLVDYKSRLDLSALEKSNSPIAAMYKNLDLTAANRKLIHEGPLTWRIQQSKKTLEVQVLLLTDVLVLMEKSEDKDKYKYHLRCHTLIDAIKEKEEMCPVISLSETIVRTARSDRGGRTFFIANTNTLLKTAQLYEFQAETPRDKEVWETVITEARDASIGISTHTVREELDQHITPEISTPTGDHPPTEKHQENNNPAQVQLSKIDEELKRILSVKMDILKQLQEHCESRPESPLRSSWGSSQVSTSSNPREIVVSAMEQASTISNVANSLLQPQIDEENILKAQGQLSESCAALQKNLSALLFAIGGPDLAAMSVSTVSLDNDIQATSSATLVAGEGIRPSMQTITSSPKPEDCVDGSLAGIPEVSVIEFDIPDPVISPWPDDVTPRTKRKGMYIDNASPVEGSDSSYVSDDNAVLSGDENIVAPPESFSGRTDYVMSPDLHMPVPLVPPPIDGHVDTDTVVQSEMLPSSISAEDLYQVHSPMQFTPRDFPDSFNLPNTQNRLSTVSENASESEA